MFPEIVLFGRTVTYYSICVFIGVMVLIFFSMKVAENRGLDYYRMLCTTMFSFIGVVVGGSLLFAITKNELIFKLINNLDKVESLEHFVTLLVPIFGGIVFYGGMIGCIFMSWVFLKLSSKKFGPEIGPYMDIGACCIPLFHFFGRMGCFLSGCCYGIECEFGFTYNHSQLESANGVSRFPVQLVEATFNLVLFFVLYNLLKKGFMKNKLMALYLIAYPVARFLLEFLRGDDHRGFVIGWVSTSQFISILLILISSTYLFVTRKKKTENV